MKQWCLALALSGISLEIPAIRLEKQNSCTLNIVDRSRYDSRIQKSFHLKPRRTPYDWSQYESEKLNEFVKLTGVLCGDLNSLKVPQIEELVQGLKEPLKAFWISWVIERLPTQRKQYVFSKVQSYFISELEHKIQETQSPHKSLLMEVIHYSQTIPIKWAHESIWGNDGAFFSSDGIFLKLDPNLEQNLKILFHEMLHAYSFGKYNDLNPEAPQRDWVEHGIIEEFRAEFWTQELFALEKPEILSLWNEFCLRLRFKSTEQKQASELWLRKFSELSPEKQKSQLESWLFWQTQNLRFD